MPKLQILAPCDKAIVSEEAGASLISIMESLTVNIAGSAEIPANAKIPLKWTVFTLWLREDRDKGKEYEQLIEMFSPSRKSIMQQANPFTMPLRSHRQVLVVMSFFVGEPGEYELRASWREKGSEKWTVGGSYEMEIKHGAPEKPQNIIYQR